MIKTLLVLSFLFHGTHLLAKTTYHIKWKTSLPLEVKTVRGPDSFFTKVGESGIYGSNVNLPITDKLPESKVTLAPDEKAVLYALIRNTGKKKIRFSVAPHSTNPGSSALGFKFKCLCNGHVYEVNPGEIWYRVMFLNTFNLSKNKDVVLLHTIFEVPEGKQRVQAHHHHDH